MGNESHISMTRRTTSRRRQDGTLLADMSERRMVWDAENRLRGLSDGGYVSFYWYDSDGNRTVKRHGGGEMLYVNSQLRKQLVDSAAYSLYPNGWYSIDNFSRFSRHIFIGGERIASVSGIHTDGMAEYDNGDIQTAGTNVSVTVNYDSLIAVQSSLITLYSDSLHAPFSGSPEAVRSVRYLGITGGLGMPGGDLEDNNHTDNSGRADNGRTYTNDSVYYYHRDHLGSTMSVTDGNANSIQTVEYTPWGEVFLERRNGSFFYSPYLYNGKELDEETVLYYYGARYYDPKISVWYSTDPMQEKYPWVTTYGYCLGNPVKFWDIFGYLPTDEEAAAIADDVYDPGKKKLPGNWYYLNHFSKYKNLKLRNDETGFLSGVYGRYDEKTKQFTEYVYATAGTNPLSIKDWGNNISQLLGVSAQYSQSISNAINLIRVLNPIDKEHFSFVGHSLGGGEASANALATGFPAITFNAAALSPLTKKFFGLNANPNIKAFIVEGEIVDYLQLLLSDKN